MGFVTGSKPVPWVCVYDRNPQGVPTELLCGAALGPGKVESPGWEIGAVWEAIPPSEGGESPLC